MNTNGLHVCVCIQLLRLAMFRSCCQQVHCQSRTDWDLEFCNFCIEFYKKPSRKTFLMQVFAGLCTGKVTLSHLMLQNTGQNVQKIRRWQALSVRLGLESCSFVQVHGICSVSDTLFTTDAAAGKIKLMTGLSGTTDFLEHLGILYDTFGITCKASTCRSFRI